MPALPAYPPITRATLRAALQQRLNNAQFWGVSELNAYIQEALRTWQAYSRYWRGRYSFNTHQDGGGIWQSFYDLAAELPAALGYNLTDADVLSHIEYHLIEPQSGIPAQPGWLGSTMFPQAAYTTSMQTRRDRFLLDTAAVVQHFIAPSGAVPQNARVTLPGSYIDMRRVAWQGPAAAGAVTTNGTSPIVNWASGDQFQMAWARQLFRIDTVWYIVVTVISPTRLIVDSVPPAWNARVYSVSGTFTQLWRDDEFAANAYDYGWTTNPQVPAPSSYSVVVTQPYTLQFIPSPGDEGVIDFLAIAQGAPLNPLAPDAFGNPAGTVLGIPDNFVSGIKWGTMADLLSQDGPGRDLQRAAYCEKRYRECVQYCRAMPTAINATINGIVTQFDSVFNFDTYSYNWQNTAGMPTVLGMASQNMLATNCQPDQSYGINLDVVINCPIYSDDVTPVTLTADMAELIVDEAQHLALFKSGGAEFQNSIVLHQNFVAQANLYRDRSSAQAPYWLPMDQANQLEFSQRAVQ